MNKYFKNTKQTLFVFLSVLLLSSFFSGCSSSSLKESIQGTWIESNDVNTITFDNGTYEYFNVGMYSETGRYSISEDSTLTMISKYGDTKRTMKYLPLKEMKEKNTSGYWCIDGDTIYLDTVSNYFTKQ